MQNKRELFCRTFGTETGRAVLKELADFAQYSEAKFYSDPRLETYMNGRRSVICEIQKNMEEKQHESESV